MPPLDSVGCNALALAATFDVEAENGMLDFDVVLGNQGQMPLIVALATI